MLVEPVEPVLSSFFIESIQVVECLGEKETEEDLDKKIERKVEEKLEEERRKRLPSPSERKELWEDAYEPPDLGWSTKWTTAVAESTREKWVRAVKENFTTAEPDNQDNYHYEWR